MSQPEIDFVLNENSIDRRRSSLMVLPQKIQQLKMKLDQIVLNDAKDNLKEDSNTGKSPKSVLDQELSVDQNQRQDT